ncbi:DMT family transporter [Paenibacillus sanguinis]|uniref:DMT family transporter n=1 Tax=Paenibacillus sanguinis TaxID=225906 RepID=UPI0003604970|nr:multidrug efflux SMR transporter [Paenibacillus sanguinis]
MSWVALILAGCFEVVGVMGITLVNQKPSARSFLIMAGGFALSFVLLAIAMKDISMGTAYAIWTGIGTVGSALLGMILYGESKSLLRLFFIGLILASVIGLKLID